MKGEEGKGPQLRRKMDGKRQPPLVPSNKEQIRFAASSVVPM
jgi:hypothetical protein